MRSLLSPRRSTQRSEPWAAPARTISLRSRWHRMFAGLIAVVLLGGAVAAVSLERMGRDYQNTAKQLETQAGQVAQTRMLLVQAAVTMPYQGGALDPHSEQAIATALRQGLAMTQSPTGRALMLAVQTQWDTVQRSAAGVNPRLSLDARAGIVGSLVVRAVPGILITLDQSAAAERRDAHMDLAHAVQAQRQAYGALITLVLLAIAVVMLLSRRLSTEVISPVSSLRQVANELASGDLTHRATVARDDEIGELARSFNAMADAIGGHHQNLTYQATHDPLTGLVNRGGFRDQVQRAFERPDRRSGTQAVLFIDLDDFKNVNDTQGHAAGDLLLGKVAEGLTQLVRPGDVVARLGGDEFAVMLDGIPGPEAAEDLANRIVTALAVPVEIWGQQIQVAASVGLTMRGEGSDLDALMREADTAMYAAKGKGKNRVERYDPSVDSAAADRGALKRDLALAVERDELVLHYQPLLDLASGALVGVEALVRWLHPTRGELPPSVFIEVAEQTGDIVKIGDWVLRTGATQMLSWQRRYGRPDLSVAINASVRQLDTPGFADVVLNVLETAGLPPESLVIEVTESVLAQPSGGAALELELLRRVGIRVALDDFGTGYSSIGYLQQLPVDILKIDKSFVADPTGNGKELLEAIVALGLHLGLEVVPEGIEREEQLARVQSLGCATGQGFLLCRPVPAAEIDRWLATGETADIIEVTRALKDSSSSVGTESSIAKLLPLPRATSGLSQPATT